MMSRRWAIYLIAASLFIISQFYRTSMAVISPQLIEDLALDTKSLSLTSAAFFYAFALTQIPIVLYLDRIGARWCMTALTLVAIIGAFLFAAAESPAMLLAGRILMGIGMACNLMGPLKLITNWFAPQRFATLSTIVFSLGTAGNIAATTPLVLLSQWLGWRGAFLAIAGLNIVLIIMFFFIVRDRPAEPHSASEALENLSGPNQQPPKNSLRQLFRMKDYWIISLATFCRYGVFAAFQALWAGPYLMFLMGYSEVTAGNLILALNIGFIVGGPFWGYLSDSVVKTRKGVVIFGLITMAATAAILAVLKVGVGIWILTLLFIGFGIFSCAGGVMYSHIKERLPLSMAGAAMTGINFFTMIGVAVFLQGMGSIMQYLYPTASMGPAAFKTALLTCAVCLLAATGFYFCTRDSSPKHTS